VRPAAQAAGRAIAWNRDTCGAFPFDLDFPKLTRCPMAKRSNTRSRAPEAIKLLKNDHDEVSALFQRYNKGHKRLSESQKESLA
jgi:hypothetical protein